MMLKKRLGSLGILLILLAWLPGRSWGQSATNGAIVGKVTDKSSGGPAIGTTIIVTGPALQGEQTAVVGESGRYRISSLPPGNYQMLFLYLEGKFTRKGIRVSINSTATVNQIVSANEESVDVTGARMIDKDDTTQKLNLGRDYLEKIPIPGTNFDSALGAAAGAQNDGAGISFSGSSSLENQYIIDGVNTTGLTYGTVGSPLAQDFIQEIEIITGGYQAEYGRSSGGIANVITKQGSNELKGTFVTRFSNDAMALDPIRVPTQSTSIDQNFNITTNWQIGFDLGGPIIKDKLWFYVGFQPQIIRRDTKRIFKRRRDCQVTMEDGELSVCNPLLPENTDGLADKDENGFFIYEDIGSQTVQSQQTTYQFISKLNYAHSPEHQGVLTVSGTPYTNEIIGARGPQSAVSSQSRSVNATGAAEWTSKFNDNKTEIQGRLGYFYQSFKRDSLTSSRNNDFQVWHRLLNIGLLLNQYEPGLFEQYKGCIDDSRPGVTSEGDNDPYDDIENCPDEGPGYITGGPGFKFDDVGSRLTGKITGIQRIELAGDHLLKGGLDFELSKVNSPRLLSGAVRYERLGATRVRAYRYVEIAPPDELDENGQPLPDSRFQDFCDRVDGNGQNTKVCDWTPSPDVQGETLNWSAFAQDSWQILPNLTLNAGMRYEEQRLRFADDLQGTVSPFTGDTYGKNAMVIKSMWAPRVGLIYDWTKEGRSKAYASWGRFYESIPMDINNRSFGGEGTLQTVYDVDQCNGGAGIINADGIADPSLCENPDLAPTPAASERLLSSGVLVQPGISGQFLDEFIIGAEYEIFDDTKIGIAYENRKLGSVIEDASIDNAQTYILSNPGEFSEDEEQKLQDRIDKLEEGSEERRRLEGQLEQYQGLRIFDKPVRNWNALKLTLNRRYSRNLFIQGSYQYGRAKGNYQGLFSSNNGQIDPNITSQYDLIELLANRMGPLPQDRPHQFKLDFYYTFDLDSLGQLTTAVSTRAFSGTPVDALGRHSFYGFNEAFLISRGSVDRTPFVFDGDLRFTYAKDLARGIRAEFFFDVFNLMGFDFFKGQQVAAVDQAYTYDAANPIVGGDVQDLVFLKQVEVDTGRELGIPVSRNPNFGNAQSARYSPPYTRVGFRVAF